MLGDGAVPIRIHEDLNIIFGMGEIMKGSDQREDIPLWHLKAMNARDHELPPCRLEKNRIVVGAMMLA